MKNDFTEADFFEAARKVTAAKPEPLHLEDAFQPLTDLLTAFKKSMGDE